jgi:hypothetical protein
MKKTRGTEITMNISDIINVVVGSVDKNNPKSIYIKFSAWANTINFDENTEYKTIIRKLTKEIKRYLYFNIDRTLFNENITMVDMDMRESGITNKKSSFMSCEVTLYQINNYLLVSDAIKDEVVKLSKHICKEIYNNDSHFKFFKDKKQAKIKLQKA